MRAQGSGVALLNVSQRCQLTDGEHGPRRKEEMDGNHTTMHISTPSPETRIRGYYVLIPFVLLTLLGCMVAVVRRAQP